MLPQYKLPYIKSFPQNPWMYCTWFYDHNYLIDIWMVCRSVFCFLVICHQNVTPKRALQIAHWFIIFYFIFFVKLPKTPLVPHVMAISTVLIIPHCLQMVHHFLCHCHLLSHYASNIRCANPTIDFDCQSHRPSNLWLPIPSFIRPPLVIYLHLYICPLPISTID